MCVRYFLVVRQGQSVEGRDEGKEERAERGMHGCMAQRRGASREHAINYWVTQNLYTGEGLVRVASSERSEKTKESYSYS